jgi:hypothetical protein
MFVWNHVARDVTLSRNLSLIDSARLYAFMNATISDSLLNTFTGKFSYGLWRPLTAIRRGSEDFNDATTADGAWSPLLGTPPYPTYPGNMAGVGACAANALALGLGRDDISFSVTWVPTPGNGPYVRQYASFSQLAQEEATVGSMAASTPLRQRGEPGGVRQARPARVLKVMFPGRSHETTTMERGPGNRGLAERSLPRRRRR